MDGAAGQPGADGHGAGHHEVEVGQVVPGRELVGDAEQVVAEAARLRLKLAGQIRGGLLVEVDRAERGLANRRDVRRDHHMAIDRHRQHVAVVVVGVLADQVDPPGSGGSPTGPASKAAFERRNRLFHQGFAHSPRPSAFQLRIMTVGPC
jgi:hypothetical protein